MIIRPLEQTMPTREVAKHRQNPSIDLTLLSIIQNGVYALVYAPQANCIVVFSNAKPKDLPPSS